ncbi:hypothetical protein BJY04DRAFT_187747 [Aspergillus karnatakaensis]|uniref:uncharacterized protein n=1 Tax=Aspergillus karnatakaensis TaxID=1810916 RepID=UPI003CCCDDF5
MKALGMQRRYCNLCLRWRNRARYISYGRSRNSGGFSLSSIPHVSVQTDTLGAACCISITLMPVSLWYLPSPQGIGLWVKARLCHDRVI